MYPLRETADGDPMSDYVNILDRITEGRTLPEGCDRWGLKAIDAAGRTRFGFEWPTRGWAEAPGPITKGNWGVTPEQIGDGICVARTYPGLRTGGYRPFNLLLVAYADSDRLSSPTGNIVRLRRAYVVERLGGEEVLRAHGHGADLSEVHFPGADLFDAHLAGANLSWADLSRTELSYANLSGAVLRRANLAGAVLRKTTLRGADLSHAELPGANLSHANLTGANLTGAVLDGANLDGAILIDAIGVDR